LGGQSLATVYVAAASFFLTFILARVLGPELFGTYSYLVTLGSLFGLLQDGGFRMLIVRELTRHSFHLERVKLFSMSLGHVLVVTGLGAGGAIILPMENGPLMSLVIVAFGFGLVCIQISSFLKGEGRFRTEALWQSAVRTSTLVCVLVALYLFPPRLEYVFLGVMVGYVFALLIQRYRTLGNFRFDHLNLVIYRAVLPFMIIDLATLVYFKIDIVMLRHFLGEVEQVGYYAGASRVLEGILLLFAPVSSILFRELRLSSHDRDRYSLLSRRWTSLALALAVPISGMGAFFASPIMVFCFGQKFIPGHVILAWLLLALVFMVPNIVLTQAALAANQEKRYAWGASAGAMLNIVLNFILIPLYGALGAVIGTLVTEGFLFLFIGIGVYRVQENPDEPS